MEPLHKSDGVNIKARPLMLRRAIKTTNVWKYFSFYSCIKPHHPFKKGIRVSNTLG